ncbi:hypothetical protein CRG98_034134 [Punica granatum]|uniref:Uncharacterized protein n=1 Tax=Punica granatum TaxID=22663 RepID=A0A2I0IN95_PUNGR|nr:hypothetical protein CRG98_034134 [Punica granatum]
MGWDGFVVTKSKGNEESEWPIGDPHPESIRNLQLGIPINSGLGPPISDPDPSIEVADVLCGYRRPRWRGQGHRLVAPTPNLSGTSHLKSSVYSRLGPPIGDPEPSTEIAGILRGYQ